MTPPSGCTKWGEGSGAHVRAGRAAALAGAGALPQGRSRAARAKRGGRSGERGVELRVERGGSVAVGHEAGRRGDRFCL